MRTLFLFLFVSLSVCGQKMVLTPGGLRSEDGQKTFVVLSVEGKTAKELYNNAVKYIQRAYKNPDEVLKGSIENEFIKFDSHADKAFVFRKRTVFDMNWTTALEFKDGKVKLEFISITPRPDNVVTPVEVILDPVVFWNKKGELKDVDEKQKYEEFFNAQISAIHNALKGDGSNKEEW